MSLIHFFRSKILWINIILIVVVVVGLVGFTYKWLDSYTNHGETITVPDLRGYTPEKIAEFLSEKNLRFQVVDSSVFDLNRPKGTVIEQDPKPNAKVKEGRTIYLTITRTVAPSMSMPDLIDVSYRQAEAIFQTYGLRVGELIYKPDLAKNAVLGTLWEGKEIHPGDPVPKGSVIDLILGDGFGNTKMPVPNLINLTSGEALFVLKASSLNIGGRYFDETVRDSTAARVYKQFPTFGSEDLSQGEAIDLYFTQSEEKIYNAQ